MNLNRQGLIAVGVGAAVFRERSILLVRRARAPFVGRWSIPGGGLEFGERLEDAARREVREETGVEIEIRGLIGVFEALPGAADRAAGSHYVLVDYLADWRAGEPIAGDDAAEARFFPVDEAQELVAWDETRRAIAIAAALRDPAQFRL